MSDSSRIIVESIEPVAAREVVQPFEDEIARLYQIPVRSVPREHEPPAAGFSEIAIVLTVVGPLAYKFFEPLVTAAGEALRDRVLALLDGARRSRSSTRIYVPLLIELGADPSKAQSHTPIRYFFYGRMDQQELLRRMRKADEHLKLIPQELFFGMGGPQENGFYWDSEQGAWRGNVWGDYDKPAYGEFWIYAPPWNIGFEDED